MNNLKKIIALLILFSLLPLPCFGARDDYDFEKAKSVLKSAQGQELLKSPQAKTFIQEIKTSPAKAEGVPAPQVVVPATPKEPSGIESAFKKDIKQYGYDIFDATAATFVSGEGVGVPVGPDYMIGPGDSFNITLWGAAEGAFRVEVNREGKIVLPKVGIVSVAGLTYGDLKPAVERELSKYYEKINVGISMGELRTIRVFIVGEVNRPGSYPVSSLSTLFSALFAAGGPTGGGTLRNIELKRGNRVVARSDLYKFLLWGDKSQDYPLQSGDTIFVPVIGPTVGIKGNVRRPAIYEIKGSADLADLLDLAGGVLPTGSLNRVQIERIINHDKKIVMDKSITLATKVERLGIPLQNMDFVQIFPINTAISNMVQLEGSVKYPGPYELKENMRIKDLIPSPKELTFSAYLPKAEIIRIDKNTMQTDVIPVNLQKLYSGDETQNLKLEMGDRIVVATEIKEEAKVTIQGEVALPGEYVIENGERLSTLIERAGGYTANAYLFGAAFSRKSVQAAQEASQREMISNLETAILRREGSFPLMSDEGQEQEQANLEKNKKLLEIMKSKMISGRVIIKFDLPENMHGTNNDIVLEDGDTVDIPKIQNTISVVGAVFQPGAQVYSQKLKASDYLNKMGGFTRYADQGAVSILRADGSTVSRQQGYNVLSSELYPGDMIIVPEKVDYVDILTIIKETTRWVYELAVTYGMIRLILTNK